MDAPFPPEMSLSTTSISKPESAAVDSPPLDALDTSISTKWSRKSRTDPPRSSPPSRKVVLNYHNSSSACVDIIVVHGLSGDSEKDPGPTQTAISLSPSNFIQDSFQMHVF